MKKDEKNGMTGRTMCTRSLSTSTSASIEQEPPGLRRSNRETPSKKPITAASSTRKSERRASLPASVTKKSGRMEKKNTASTLQRSANGNNVSSPNSKGSDKPDRNADTSSDDEQMKDKNENSVEESTIEIKKREPKMSGRAFRALFRGQHKKSEALENQPGKEDIGTNQDDYINSDGDRSKDSAETLAQVVNGASPEQAASPSCHLVPQNDQMKEVNPSSNEEELVVVGCSRRVPAGNDDVRDGNTDCPPHANSESKRLSVGETNLEKDTDFPSKLIRDTEKMVDASPMVETGSDSVIGSPSENPETQKLPVSIASLESDIDLPLKRKRDTTGIVLNALPKVANGGEPFMSSNGVIPSSSGCKNNNQPETCSTCEKRQKVNGEFEDLRVCSCTAQPVQESDHVAQGAKETEPVMSRDYGENRKNIQEDKSYDPKLYSSMYPEYWVPVQLSDVQLEQYCRTLLSKSVSLSSLSKNDLGALDETLTSVRKTCEHPYVADASLKVNQLLTKNLEPHEILDVEIKASGKLHLLDAMLTQIKENGLKAVIYYQTTQIPQGLLLGNILEDFVSGRFGQKSYEHVICTSKNKNAVNNFNKESQCFVLLLEKRACSQSIKLLRAEAFILFGSNLNPSLDVKLLEKIKIESSSERTKIFRLYSTFTVEEKALILARQNKLQTRSVENLSRLLTHELLMWGASYLFDKLNHFHGGESPDSGVPCEQAIMDGVIQEFSSILSSKGGEKNEGKLCLVLEAKHARGIYSTDSTLFGEEHVKLSDESSPNIFWTKLLGGKKPTWKYCSGTPQRNRKRVQYFADSEDSAKVGNGGNTKKRKKASDDVTNPTADKNERKAPGKDHMGKIGALESPIVQALHSTCSSTQGNDASGLYSTGVHISGIPENMLAGRDWKQAPRESQRSLHALLKLEMAKLGKILHLSEDWTSMVENFLEYVIENHHVCEKPATILQAFQIALIWIAALLVKQKPKKKESLVLAKSELAFSCSREEVDYIYFLLYCVKSLFLERTQGMESMHSSMGEECMTEKRGSHCSSATKDIKKAISDIKKKCKKQELKLVQTHEEEKVELVKRNDEKKKELETKKKLEAALIRLTCSQTSTHHGLKQLDLDYERKLDEITSEMDECLKGLEQMHEEAKKKIAENEACWISRIENWAQAEVINCVPIESGNDKHFSAICLSNAPKNALDIQTCNDANGETTHTYMVSKGNQVTEAENTFGTMSSGNTQQVHEMVSSRNDKAMDVLTLPCEQPTDNAATKSQSNDGASFTVPGILIPAGCQEEFAAANVHLEKPCSLGKEIPDELVLNRPQIASVLETRGSSESDQDDQDICPIPSSPVGKQLDAAANIQGQNIEAAIEIQPAGSETVDTSGFAASKQDDQDILCPTPSSPAGKQPDTAANIQGQDIEEAIETQPAGSETVETGCLAASEQGDQVMCPLPSSPAGNQPEPANIEGENIKASAESHKAGPDAVEIGDSAVSDQETMGAQDASILVGTQSDLAANVEDQNVKTSAEPHIAGPVAVEIGDSAVSDQETMGVQDACSLPSSLVGTQSNLAANIEDQNITTVAQLHTTGSDALDTAGFPASSLVGTQSNLAANIEDQNITTVAQLHTTGSDALDTAGFPASSLVGTQSNLAANIEDQNITTVAQLHTTGSDALDTAGFPVSSLVGTQSNLAANIEDQNITTVAQLHTTGSDALDTAGFPVSNQVAQDASPLPNEVVNVEGLNNTTVAEPHTSEPDACEMEIAESGPQVEQPAVAANNLVQLVSEGSGVEPSAAGVTAFVPSLLNNGTGQIAAQQPVPQVPFPVFNDPFQYELEKLSRESENTKKTYEEKKLNLKAELERKIAEVRAEYQRKFHEVEVEHKSRVTEIETNKNLVTMNKLLASAFLSKCTDRTGSQPSAATRGRIQQLAQAAAQMNAQRDSSTPAPLAAPIQPQVSSYPRPMPQPRQPHISSTAPSPALTPAPAPAPVQPQASSYPRPMPQPTQPHISSTAPSPGLASVPLPAPTPVQPQASSYPRPMPQPRQPHISSTAPSPSPSATPATNQVVRRVPPPHLRSSSSIAIATTTTPTSSSLPPQALTYSSPVLVQQQQQQEGQQQNLSSGLGDVVCLSDDE